MAKYVFVYQNGGIKSDRKNMLCGREVALHKMCIFFFFFFFAFLPFYLNRYCINVMFLPETKISKYARVWSVLLYGN